MSELSDLNLRLCFSALCLKVKNCQLAFLSEKIIEKVSVSVYVLSFLFVASVLIFVR